MIHWICFCDLGVWVPEDSQGIHMQPLSSAPSWCHRMLRLWCSKWLGSLSPWAFFGVTYAILPSLTWCSRMPQQLYLNDFVAWSLSTLKGNLCRQFHQPFLANIHWPYSNDSVPECFSGRTLTTLMLQSAWLALLSCLGSLNSRSFTRAARCNRSHQPLIDAPESN